MLEVGVPIQLAKIPTQNPTKSQYGSDKCLKSYGMVRFYSTFVTMSLDDFGRILFFCKMNFFVD